MYRRLVSHRGVCSPVVVRSHSVPKTRLPGCRFEQSRSQKRAFLLAKGIALPAASIFYPFVSSFIILLPVVLGTGGFSSSREEKSAIFALFVCVRAQGSYSFPTALCTVVPFCFLVYLPGADVPLQANGCNAGRPLLRCGREQGDPNSVSFVPYTSCRLKTSGDELGRD